MVRAAAFLAASLIVLTLGSARSADEPKDGSAALERKLLGTWQGGLCIGELTLRADGTFERQHYSPSDNTLSGVWQVRWNALPPMLVLDCKASDYAPNVGKMEVKLIQLDDSSFTYKMPNSDQEQRFVREQSVQEKELAALQGTWIPLTTDGGESFTGDPQCRHVIRGDKIRILINGATQAEGKVIVDPTRNPKRLTLEFPGRTDSIIYVRAGDHVIYCGNRSNKSAPAEFVNGSDKGGDYLMAWKIER